MEIEDILHRTNSPSEGRFRNASHSLLSRADARGSADIIYRMWRVSLICGLGIVNDVTKYRSRTEYW